MANHPVRIAVTCLFCVVVLSLWVSAVAPAGSTKSARHKQADRALTYRHFNSCLGAVEYLFRGRWDYQRALMVVKRESHFRPSASNGSHLGCAEESTGMRTAYLKGPWNDPYWNVRAMLTVVSRGGWCNWDLVNYCNPGGEFGP